MLHNSTLSPASAPLHVPPLLVCLPLSLVHVLLVCLFVSPSRLFLLIDGQWTSAKSDCTHSIRRGLGRSVRVCPRPGAYVTSRYLQSSDISTRGHSMGTGPC